MVFFLNAYIKSWIYCSYVTVKMSTMLGLIHQKYYNASISFFEIPPAGATANDGTDLLWPWATATSASSKSHLSFRAQTATWINLLWVSQLPRSLKHRPQTIDCCFLAADEICHYCHCTQLQKQRTCSQKAGAQRNKCPLQSQNNYVLRSVKHQQI